jgi:hypothetical protein
MKTLSSYEADLNAKDAEGITPLYLALLRFIYFNFLI